MQKTFVLNGKTYIAKELEFDSFCELEELGVPMEKIGLKPLSVIRAYVALCGDMTLEQASSEIQTHMMNGGKLTDVGDKFGERLSESGFFRQFIEGAKTENPEMETEEAEEPKKTVKKNTKA